MLGAFLPTLLKVSFAVAVMGHGADLAATEHCLGASRCRELNPWLLRYDNPVAFGLAKMGVASGTEILIYEFSQNHRRLAISVNITIGGSFTALGIRNAQVAR